MILDDGGEELDPEAGVSQEASLSLRLFLSHVHIHTRAHTYAQSPNLPQGPLWQDSDWEEIFVKYTLAEELVSIICKELLQRNNKMTNNQMLKGLKWAKYLNRRVTKEGIWMTNKPIKGAQHHYSLKNAN